MEEESSNFNTNTKILHVCFSDLKGGSAKAAYRLHHELLFLGINSAIVVFDKQSNEQNIVQFLNKWTKKLHFIKYKIAGAILKLQKKDNAILHSLNLFSSGLGKYINSSDATIVHIHWIGREMLSISEVAKINKPFVWTLHDSWVFCGAEHHPGLVDKRYINGYNRSKRLIDLNRYTWLRKKKYWRFLAWHFIAPSKWIESCARSSILLFNKTIQQIYNGINTDFYKPREKNATRRKYNFPENKKLILFGAVSATKDINKGFHLLLKAIKKIAENYSNVEFIIFGVDDEKDFSELGFKYYSFAELTNEEMLIDLYSAADAFVLPSLIENLSTVAIESMACETPVVAFNIGGNGEIIDHLKNGYLVEPYSVEDLIKGILFFVNNNEKNIAGINARQKAQKFFNIKESVKQHIELYKKMLV